MKLYEEYIHQSRYARYLPEKKRRETWEETVDRYISFWIEQVPNNRELHSEIYKCKQFILDKKVMPSMRCLMTAGAALEKDNVAGYNCCFVAMDNARKFSEIMYILMCGTGVGFSVSKSEVDKLPMVAEDFHPTDTIICVPDSKIGWSKSFKEIITLLYSGQIPKWDISKVRKAGMPLKTFGGRASGAEPLVELFRFCVEVFQNAKGRKLKPIEVHDIVCKIADIVVVGGVRRSALISLSDLDDREMQKAKSGQWWLDHPHRALANNSVCYMDTPALSVFLDECSSLYESKSGERGIYSVPSAQRVAERNGRRDHEYKFGTNPCSEIILRDSEFCNLSEVIVRAGDSQEVLKEKVRVATILGTLQSTLTDFRFLSKDYKNNCDEERLLGVSLTGILDHASLGDPNNKQLPKKLQELREVSIETNKDWADKLQIPQSVAITCVKPSGTVSQLCNTASGIHPRYSSFYIRNVRGDKKDPLSKFMIDKGIPCKDAPEKPNDMYVFSFPICSPSHSVMRNEYGAMKQLKLWKVYAEHWCEHKPSVTIYYKEKEFLPAMSWVYDNFESMSGISFLPHTDHIYQDAPYEEIDRKKYGELLKAMPYDIDWTELNEELDYTTSSQELACTAGACEI